MAASLEHRRLKILAGTLRENLDRLNVLAESRFCAEQVSLEYACETLTDPSPPIEHSPAFDCAWIPSFLPFPLPESNALTCQFNVLPD